MVKRVVQCDRNEQGPEAGEIKMYRESFLHV
jgi:hypothetical protein